MYNLKRIDFRDSLLRHRPTSRRKYASALPCNPLGSFRRKFHRASSFHPLPTCSRIFIHFYNIPRCPASLSISLSPSSKKVTLSHFLRRSEASFWTKLFPGLAVSRKHLALLYVTFSFYMDLTARFRIRITIHGANYPSPWRSRKLELVTARNVTYKL